MKPSWQIWARRGACQELYGAASGGGTDLGSTQNCAGPPLAEAKIPEASLPHTLLQCVRQHASGIFARVIAQCALLIYAHKHDKQ